MAIWQNKKFLFFIVKIIIAALLLTVLVKKIDIHEIRSAFSHAHLQYVLMALGLLGFNLFFQFKKWQLLVRLEKPSATGKEIFLSLLSAFPLGIITPGRLGEFGKAFFIKNCQWPRLLGLALIEKFFSLNVIYLMGLIGLAYFMNPQLEKFILVPVLMTGIILTAILLFFMLRPDLFAAILDRFKKAWKNRKISQLLAGIELFTPKVAPRLLLYTASHFLTYIVQFYLLARAFAPISFIKAYLSISSTMMVKTLLPISIGDLGVRESAAVFFFGFFNYPAPAAFDASLLLFSINILIPSLTGLIFIVKRLNLNA